MQAIPFKKDHLDLVEELNLDEHEATKEDILQIYEGLCDESIMLTIVDDGRVVCICGIKSLWQGVGEAINIRTKYLESKHARFIRKQFDYQLNFYNRIQTHSRPNMWNKWHSLMGFEKEAVLKRYCNNEDKVLWVRFK